MSGGPSVPSIYSTRLMRAGEAMLTLAGKAVNARMFRTRSHAIDLQASVVDFHNLALGEEKAHARLRGEVMRFMLANPELVDQAYAQLHAPPCVASATNPA